MSNRSVFCWCYNRLLRFDRCMHALYEQPDGSNLTMLRLIIMSILSVLRSYAFRVTTLLVCTCCSFGSENNEVTQTDMQRLRT